MSMPRARNKYNATKTEYKGRTFDSKAEAAYAADLDVKLAAGEIEEWVPQPKVWLAGAWYTPDFLVVDDYGAHYVDVKGFETAKFRMIRQQWAEAGRLPLLIVKGNLVERVVPKAMQETDE